MFIVYAMLAILSITIWVWLLAYLIEKAFFQWVSVISGIKLYYQRLGGTKKD